MMTEPGPASAAPNPLGKRPTRPRRWLIWALLASLGLNLLMLGAIGHRAWLWRGGGVGFGPPIHHMLRHLPPERRDALAPRVEAFGEALRSLRQGSRQARKSARAALLKDPFDRASFEAAARTFLDLENLGGTATITTLADLAATMTADERLMLSRRLRFLRGPGDGG